MYVRFWGRVDLQGDGCWPWTASVDRWGYGHIRINGRLQRAHRVAWELCFGPIPEGVCVLHTCDNPRCVRPIHLFLGSQADNSRDKAKKGRAAGERNPGAKLTATDVVEIRQRRRASALHRELAADFNVHRTTISNILSGKNWRSA